MIRLTFCMMQLSAGAEAFMADGCRASSLSTLKIPGPWCLNGRCAVLELSLADTVQKRYTRSCAARKGACAGDLFNVPKPHDVRRS